MYLFCPLPSTYSEINIESSATNPEVDEAEEDDEFNGPETGGKSIDPEQATQKTAPLSMEISIGKLRFIIFEPSLP